MGVCKGVTTLGVQCQIQIKDPTVQYCRYHKDQLTKPVPITHKIVNMKRVPIVPVPIVPVPIVPVPIVPVPIVPVPIVPIGGKRQCSGTTSKGNPCTIVVSRHGTGLCRYHKPRAPVPPMLPITAQVLCTGTCTRGRPCKYIATVNGLCKYHNNPLIIPRPSKDTSTTAERFADLQRLLANANSLPPFPKPLDDDEPLDQSRCFECAVCNDRHYLLDATFCPSCKNCIACPTCCYAVQIKEGTLKCVSCRTLTKIDMTQKYNVKSQIH
jgi:hypothetical protein